MQALQHHREIAHLEVLAVEIDRGRGQRRDHDVARFLIPPVGRLRIHAIQLLLQRHRAATHSYLQSSAAQLVEHADFLRQTHGVVQRGHIDHGPEAQFLGALRDRGQVDIRRGCEP